ncbi:MAG: hypothetical protein ACRDA4_05595 [Filifactoraceae bacterium]
MELIELVYKLGVLVFIGLLICIAYGTWKSTDKNSTAIKEAEPMSTNRNKYTDYIIYKNLRK